MVHQIVFLSKQVLTTVAGRCSIKTVDLIQWKKLDSRNFMNLREARFEIILFSTVLLEE